MGGCIAKAGVNCTWCIAIWGCIARGGALQSGGVHCTQGCTAIWGGALQIGVHCTWGCIGVHCTWEVYCKVGCIAFWGAHGGLCMGLGDALQRGLLVGLTPTGPVSGCIHTSHPAACPASCFSTLLPPHHLPLPPPYPSARGAFGVWGFGFFGSE